MTRSSDSHIPGARGTWLGEGMPAGASARWVCWQPGFKVRVSHGAKTWKGFGHRASDRSEREDSTVSLG